MILSQPTIDKFGYSPDNLSMGSHKRVVVQCDDCGAIFDTVFKNLQGSRRLFADVGIIRDTCRSCSRQKTIEYDNLIGNREEKMKKAKEKGKATSLKKYGVEYPSQHPDVIKKVKVAWELKTQEELDERSEKSRASMLAKYGDNYAKIIRDRAKKTNLERYGVEDATTLPFVVARREATMRERYGVYNFSKSPLSRPRIRKTWKEKYGVEEIFNDAGIKDKIHETNVERYGTAHPNFKYGKVEGELRAWLKEQTGYEFNPSSEILKPYEIDCYSPELKIGIEYCGLYWHSQNPEIKGGKIDKNYHFNKWKKCEESGVRLITIFEDEWMTRQGQVKGYLKSALGVNSTKVFARNCEVRQIDKKEGCLFIANYHIQGSNSLGRNFAGLFYNNNLIGVMSFGSHPRKSDVMVLDRMCFKDGYSVVGGASKLFKFLIKITGYKKIISWSDNRWSCGNVYQRLGFAKNKSLGADYSYIVRKSRTPQRLSKQSQKKSSTGCPDDMTEKEWCEKHFLYRIWDCGKIQWLWEA